MPYLLNRETDTPREHTMRLIEDSPTRRVFEERGDEARFCYPKGTMVHNETALILPLPFTIVVVVLTLIGPTVEKVVQGEKVSSGAGLVTLIGIIVVLACVVTTVVYLWRLYRKEQTRVIHYVFELRTKTLSIEEIDASPRGLISADKYHSFVIEFHPPCHSIRLSGAYGYEIYSRSIPPPAEFVDALKMIGLRQVEKLKEPHTSYAHEESEG
jgi:hypothetical protein